MQFGATADNDTGIRPTSDIVAADMRLQLGKVMLIGPLRAEDNPFSKLVVLVPDCDWILKEDRIVSVNRTNDPVAGNIRERPPKTANLVEQSRAWDQREFTAKRMQGRKQRSGTKIRIGSTPRQKLGFFFMVNLPYS